MFFKNKKNSKKAEAKNVMKTVSHKKTPIDKTSVIILLISLGLIGVFIAGIKLSKPENEIKKPDIKNIEKIEQNINEVVEDKIVFEEEIVPVIYIKPNLYVNAGNSIKFEEVLIGKSKQKTIYMEAEEASLEIESITLSREIPSLELSENCTGKGAMESSDTCTISLDWAPEEEMDSSIILIIKWKALDKDEEGNIHKENHKINISLESYEEREEVVEVEEFEEEIEDEVQVKSSLSEWDLSCYKFASKAHDFTGTFIGWIQVNKNVYSTDCAEVIGILQDSGEILAVNTGKVIGRGPSLSGLDADKKLRSSQELPESGAISFDDEYDDDGKAEMWSAAMSNRLSVKSGEAPEGQGFNYQVEDVMGVYSKGNPFGRFREGISPTLPSDATYFLRRNKPIPAVINNAIGTHRLPDGVPVSATVERNVYGGKGRAIIIPAGTQVYGSVTNDSLNGEEGETMSGESFTKAYDKVSISWTRMVRPDGAEFEISANTGDAQGRNGVAGKRDTNYINDVLLTPLLTSALPAIMELAAGDDQDVYQEGVGLVTSVKTAQSKAVGAFKESFAPALEKLVNQSLSETINPALVIPAGTRITIFVQEDLSLCWETEDGMNTCE